MTKFHALGLVVCFMMGLLGSMFIDGKLNPVLAKVLAGVLVLVTLGSFCYCYQRLKSLKEPRKK